MKLEIAVYRELLAEPTGRTFVPTDVSLDTGCNLRTGVTKGWIVGKLLEPRYCTLR